MGKYVQWITHKGTRILFVDAVGLREAEYIAALEEMKKELLKGRQSPPVLIDLTKWEMTPASINKAKEVTAALKKAGVPFGPNALVGMSGLQKSVAALSVKYGVCYATNIEEAKEWLVKEEEKRREQEEKRPGQ
jgi:hypothetical protein